MGDDTTTRVAELEAEVSRLRAELHAARAPRVDDGQAHAVVAALRHSEERLRSIVENAPNIIYTTNRDGTLTFLNRTDVEGLSPDDVIGVNVLEFVHSEDRERISGNIARVVAEGVPMSYRARASEATGGTQYVVRVGPLFDDGEVVGLAFVMSDVTELDGLEERLKIADRMVSVGLLAAGVAHEINNPLTYMLMQLERVDSALGDEGFNAALLRERVGEVLDGAMRIGRIVEDLGVLSGRQQSAAGNGDVAVAVDSALGAAMPEIRFRAQLEVDIGGELPAVAVGTNRLAQVMVNLLVNAAQAIPEGRVADNTIRVKASVEGDGVLFEVTDTGEGVADTIAARIFEPFVTGKPGGVAQGLGLYICHNIVTSRGGRIEHRPLANGETCFCVWLPRASELISESPTDVAAGASPERLRVLVVDDEPAIRDLLAAMIEGHSVTVAGSGREAIERLDEGGFDLILCDLIMPDLTGIDVYNHLAAQGSGREQAIVFMTGGAFTAQVREFLADKRHATLNKPFGIDEVEALLARRGSR